MSKFILGYIIALIIANCISLSALAQKELNPGQDFKSPFKAKVDSIGSQKTVSPNEDTIPILNKTEYYSVERNENSIYIKFTPKNTIAGKDFFKSMSSVFKFNSDDRMNFIKSEKDNSGLTHYTYQQFYKGVEVMGGQYLVHEKNSKIISSNGHFYTDFSLKSTPLITPASAIQFAINIMAAKKYKWEIPEEEQFLKQEKKDMNATYYPAPTLIIAAKNGVYTKENFRLCYKVNINAADPYQIYDLYIDANTGELVNKISKINDGDFEINNKKKTTKRKEEENLTQTTAGTITPIIDIEKTIISLDQPSILRPTADISATANTLYSGSKSITTDSYNGLYRLRETARPIQTLNMKNGTSYPNAVDFSNSSTNWFTKEIVLDTIKILTVNTNWEDVFGEKILNGGAPDIYIEIKDANNNVIWTKANAYYENTFPPIVINTGKIALLSGTYTLSIYDYDLTSSDDLLGSFSFNAISGTSLGTSNGTSVSISRSSRNNPGLDVHWAMEKVYDFYLSQFGRNSFDNAGGIIKNYVHKDIAWNNANWNGTAMSYGDGDNVILSPLTSIDIVGHEFTHAVVQNNGHGGLNYQGESGALNESFADIFGTAIEFYGATSPNWQIGESITLQSPFYSRSMFYPSAGGSCLFCGYQPETYSTSFFWINPSSTQDFGGVHTNSGVQNYWYYLLSQGGSGTNDNNDPYNVTGIGITKATKIAYYNLTTQLTSNATYFDAYNGSLQVAETLYGNPSAEYTEVKKAWYAVGVGNDPINYCSGTTTLSTSSGSFSDGSGEANYNNNQNCKWVIAPPGATQITLNFTSFATEANYDSVFVYDGPDENSPLLMTWWGNTLPPSKTTTAGKGAMCVKFKTDATTTSAGWNANYTSIGITPTCSGVSVLASSTGTFTDGSGVANYGNNQFCKWIIAPPCATSVTLSFSQFITESGYDGVIVYNGNNTNAPVLGTYSGTTLPASITANSGQMLVAFFTDYSTTGQGFSASYTSTGAAFCSGTTTLNTLDNGLISDGSGTNKYCNNQNCSWLIQPPQANSITLNFSSFNVEPASSDGKSIYDAVEIYDGTTTSATLLGRFAGNNIPPAVTSSGGSMLVKFYSDFSNNDSGWAAYYTSSSPSFCNSANTLTAVTGSFTDGSGVANLYANNSNCSWLIQPLNADSIKLSFTEFNTERDYDVVIVYNGADTTSPILGIFSGTTIPASVTATGGSMLVLFLSNEKLRANGFTANYTSSSNIYTFTGNGNWNVASNWSNNRIPPNPFKAGSIFIDHSVGGKCLLDINQTISQSSKITVKTGKNLLIQGALNIQH